jgi:hypothetical protein
MASTTINPQDSTINTSWQLQQFYTDTTKKTDGVQGPTGAGNIAGVNAAPDAAGTSNLSEMMASIAGLIPKMSGDQLDVLIVSLTSKMKDTMDKSDKDAIKTSQDAKRVAIAEKRGKLEEALKKIQDAEDAQKHASIWDKIKLAFQYLGAILSMVAGAVMVATGVGAVAGAMLIASGAVLLALAIDQTVSMATAKNGQDGLGALGLMCKAFAKLEGKSDEEAEQIAEKGQMGLRIGLMGVALILAGPSMVMGIASMVSSATTTATEIASDAEENATIAEEGAAMGEQGAAAADEVTTQAEQIQQIAEKVLDVVNDFTAVGSAITEVGSSVTHYQASSDQADAKHAQADAKRFEAMQQFLDDMIDMALSHLKNNGDRFSAMLDSVTDAMKDRADTMSRATFKA